MNSCLSSRMMEQVVAGRHTRRGTPCFYNHNVCRNRSNNSIISNTDSISDNVIQLPLSLVFMEPIHVLGGGSIGLLWAASIRAAFPSYPIALLLREHHRSKLETLNSKKNKYQATVCLMQQRRPRMIHIPAELIPTSPTATTSTATTTTATTRVRPIRNLIVATKAFDAVDAVRSVLDRLLVPIILQQPTSAFPSTRSPESATITTTLTNPQPYLDETGPFRLYNLDNNLPPSNTVLPVPAPQRRIILLCNGALAVKEELQSMLRSEQERRIDQLSSSASLINAIELVLATTTHGAYVLPSSTSNASSTKATKATTTTTLSSSFDHDSHQENNNSDDNDNHHIYTVVHAGVGSTYIEGPRRRLLLNPLARLWHMAGLLSSSSDNDGNNVDEYCLNSRDMNIMLWKKLAANCVINPLTALHQCTNGELWHALQQQTNSSSSTIATVAEAAEAARQEEQRHEDGDHHHYPFHSDDLIQWSFVQEIVQEVSQVALFAVMKEQSFPQQYDDDDTAAANDDEQQQEEQASLLLLQQLQPSALLEFCQQVFHDTAHNQSSMWQDVQHGRPRTEIDYLNGYVVRKSIEWGLGPAPANQRLVDAIHKRVGREREMR